MAGTITSSPQKVKQLTIRPKIINALFRLRLTLLARSFQGPNAVSRIIGTVLLLVFLGPTVVFIMFGEIVGLRYLTQSNIQEAENITFLILSGIFLLWALLPLLQFTVNESLDITKLTIYPVSQAEMMFGLILSTLVDIPTIGLILALAGIAAGWTQSLPQLAGYFVILIITYVATISFSQMILSSFLGLLRTRKWRDISIFLFTFIALSISLGFQLLSASAHNFANINTNVISALLNGNLNQWYQFLPPGMASSALNAIYRGDLLSAGLWAVGLLAYSVLFVWLWSSILARALVRPEEFGSAKTRRRKHAIAVSQKSAAGKSLIPAQITAFAIKDLQYLWRDPRFKRVMLNVLYWIGLLVVFSFEKNPISNYFLYFIVFSGCISLSSFAFGYEGPAMTQLAVLPINPRYMLFGKNLAVLVFSGISGAILITVQTFLTHSYTNIGETIINLLVILFIGLGLGNVISVVTPTYVPQQGIGRRQQDSGTSTVNAFSRMGIYFLAMGLALPMFILPPLLQFFQMGNILLFVLVVGVIYGAGIYIGATFIAANIYYRRLPQIISVVTRE